MNETDWLQISTSINVHKTLVEYFEYTVAPRRRPPRVITTTVTRSSLC